MSKTVKYLKLLSVLFVCLYAFDMLANEQVVARRVVAQSDEQSADCSLAKKIYCSLMTPDNCEDCLECSMSAKPEDYCSCVGALEFHFGIDTVITGPVWYRAKVQDIIDNGLAAYWFADDSLDLSLYMRCDVAEGMQTLSVGPNNYNIKSPERIVELMEQYGEIAELASSMSVYIHVVPYGTGEGRAILNKYGEGFHSTCDDLFGVYYWMRYTHSYSDNVFALPPAKATWLKFIQWTPLRVQPTDRFGSVTMTISSKSCTEGEVLVKRVLEDSTRVYFADNAMLQKAKTDNDTLYIRFEGDNRGEIRMLNTAKYLTDTSDTTLCEGKTLKLGQVEITADTIVADTTFLKLDTFLITSMNVHFTDVDTMYDVLRTEAKFPQYYRGQVVRQYGQMEFIEKITGSCSQYVYLTVEPIWQTTYETADTTLCEGKTIRLGGKTISTDAIANDTVILGVSNKSDKRIITTWNVKFDEPELEYDTITINKRMLPYNYETVVITRFGDHTLTIRADGECTRKVNLHVEESMLPLQYRNQTADTIVCRGKVFEINGKTLAVKGTLIDSVAIAEDTIIITQWNVQFSQPMLEYDTISVLNSQLPTDYDGVAIGGFGTRTILVEKEGECTRRVQLTVLRAMEYKYQSAEEYLCEGMYFELDGVKHTESFVYSDTVQTTEYQSVVTTHNINFVAPALEIIEDEVLMKDMPYQIADTTIAEYGTHTIYITQDGECSRLVQLTLNRALEYVEAGSRDTSVCHGMYIDINGERYWNNAVVKDTLEAVDFVAQIVEWHLNFTIPEATYDTLYMSTEDFPYQLGDTTLYDYGQYEVLTLNEGKCDELLILTLMPSATAIKNHIDNTLSIYPTKVKHGEQISIYAPAGGEMQVVDILGRVIKNGVLTEGENKLVIEVAGHYMIRVITPTKTEIRKIIVGNQ